MQVFATARSLEALKGLAEKGVELFTLDVTSEAIIVELQAQIETGTGGGLNMLFNNAGLSKSRSIRDRTTHAEKSSVRSTGH
jgi:NADP-dependent 3-hydroxy acid dehydrogenase YdfG